MNQPQKLAVALPKPSKKLPPHSLEEPNGSTEMRPTNPEAGGRFTVLTARAACGTTRERTIP